MKQYIEELFKMRSGWVDSNRENGFDEGLSRLLKELYPDNAHFLYELLQNAEDARATSVEFKLLDNHLVFEHNGREFTKNDIKGITGIGTTWKKDDLNTIGKFGVGFKAVFSYTNSPHVFCDSCCFAITDMVCPICLDSPNDLENGITRFEFPFDNPKKPQDIALQEIKKGLEDFSSATLLFLHNIKEIRWNDGETKKYLKLSQKEKLATLPVFGIESSSKTTEQWLRLSAPCKEAPKQSVSIAFKLDYQNNKNGKYEFQITETEGNLCIFFPADKETTNLKFHIHAPFISTVARDSIPYKNLDNISLRDQLVQLLVDSLPKLRDEGLLIANFLGVLPNDKDGLSEFYEPFMSKIVETMKVEDLVPDRLGWHDSAENLTKPVGRIYELISDKDLEFLSDGEHRMWSVGVMRNTPADHFLNLLEITEWSIEDLYDSIRKKWAPSWGEVEEKDEKWLLSKDVSWIRNLYLFLVNGEISWRMKKAKIIISSNRTIDKGENIVFNPEKMDELTGIQFLHPAILKGKKEQSEKIKDFLKKLGVSDLDEKHYIQSILNQYYKEDSPDPSKKQHLDHMRQFVEYWKKTDDHDIFADHYIFYTDEEGGLLILPSQTYIDVPLMETRIALIYKDKKYLVSGCYTDLGKSFLDFAKIAGVQYQLDLRKGPTKWGQPGCNSRETNTSIDNDYFLPKKVAEILKSDENYELSLIVWKLMNNIHPAQLKGKYRPNQQHSIEERDSAVISFLKKYAWIPSKDGVFYKPEEMTKEMLPDKFIFDNQNGWLDAVKFGEEAKKKTEKYKNKKELLKNLGIPFELVDELEKVTEEKRSELLQSLLSQIKNAQQKPSFPKSTSKNPERRTEKTRGEYESATGKTFKRRSRSVRTSKSEIEPKPYLEHLYTNEDDQLVCQMCEKEMPFKLRDQSYYFEAIQLFDDLKKETHQVYLALCPVCAAKYRWLVKKHDRCIASFKQALLKPTDELLFFLDMKDSKVEPLSLRFTETHLQDVQTILKEEDF